MVAGLAVVIADDCRCAGDNKEKQPCSIQQPLSQLCVFVQPTCSQCVHQYSYTAVQATQREEQPAHTVSD